MYHLTFTTNKKYWKKERINIFLGETMLPGKLEETHSDYKFIIPNWHWDDLSKIEKDDKYINFFYEKLIISISSTLNQIHNENWSVKSWKILIGPWLKRYLKILFDRVEQIKEVSKSYNLKSITIYKSDSYDDFFSSNFEEFHDRLKEENFNIHLFSLIANKLLKDKDLEKTSIDKFLESKEKTQPSKNTKNIIKLVMKSKFFKNFFSYFIKKNKFYFHGLPLNSKSKKINLLWKLKIFPHLGFTNIPVKSTKKISHNIRKRLIELLKKNIQSNNFFENYALDLIYFFIPECYLESFNLNKNLAIKEFKYINPKYIIDQTGYHKDEIFKFWLAQTDKDKKKIVLIQHGGEYEVFFPENDFVKQELEISNIYLSWGWKKENYSVLPITCPISFDKKNNVKENSINVILAPFTRFYSGSAFYIHGSAQRKNIELILNFLKSLDEDQHVRLIFHPPKFNIYKEDEFKNFIRDHLNQKKNLSYAVGIKNYINSTNLNIFTYLGTPFDQAISSNIPSMVLLSNYNFLNKKYQQVFESLQKNKIFHEHPNKLIDHLKDISGNTDTWWNKDLTQKAKSNYCSNFAREPANSSSIIQVLKKLYTS